MGKKIKKGFKNLLIIFCWRKQIDEVFGKKVRIFTKKDSRNEIRSFTLTN